MVIIALGKLGARELNFSSDIDLIFAYSQPGRTTDANRAISSDEFFTRLGRRLIKLLGQATPQGFVFRCDMRLRPFGDEGPLAMSFDAMERYYQEQGRDWERYAWIKARVVAGDRDGGHSLLRRLHPFVYRRYFDYGAFESLRSMKQMIALEVTRKGLKHNIKLGPGGIREIEFFGQIFQLIRGGVTPELQRPGIQSVLKVLADRDFVPEPVYRELSAAYSFLRRTENRLQEADDRQTHDLPQRPLEQARLGAAMGFENYQLFIDTLQDHRDRVHRHFEMLLEPGKPDHRAQEIEQALHGVWQEFVEKTQSIDIIANTGYSKPHEVLGLLEYLRGRAETRSLSRIGRQRLDKLMPRVLIAAATSKDPDSTFSRLVDVIKTIERRTSYLALLLENPSSLTHLVRLAEASPWLASFLAQHPVLLDELLDARTLYRPPAVSDLRRELADQLARVAPDELEYQLEQLCIFKQINVLRVAAADVSGTLPLMRVSDHLSAIAETVIDAVVESAWHYLVAKHGQPACRLSGRSCRRGFAVIAYGKLGGLELGYRSDLDLVFLHVGADGQTRGGDKPIDNTQFFNRLGQRVVHILTAHTRAGRAYEIDMRLRPSGSAGILVSHIDAFYDYQLESAWTWEHQALIKARPISGEPLLTERFESIRSHVLSIKRNRRKLRNEVVAMRRRMRRELLKTKSGMFDLKQEAGGMVDIEFLVQYLVLRDSWKYPPLLKWTDTVRLLQVLSQTDLIHENTAHVLKHAYLIYRAAAHQLSLQEKPGLVPQDRFRHLQQRVREIWQSVFGADPL
jgi:glutamate-ammonia-ligase adenylyltransferase